MTAYAVINDAGLAIIKTYEGYGPSVYADANGYSTVGYGHRVLPRDNLPIGATITQAQADEFLAHDLEVAEKAVDNLAPADINENQFSGLTALVFNIGEGAFSRSTLLKRLKDNDTQGAADEFLKWVHAGGKILEGLVKRRTAERDLFLTPV